MKGVTGNTQKLFTHNCFKNVLSTRENKQASNYQIKSDNHQLFAVKSNRICLSAYDDKRFIFKNGIESLPYGHHSVVDDVFFRQILDNWDDIMDQVIRCSSGSETIGYSENKTAQNLESNHSNGIQQGLLNANFQPVDWGFLQREYTERELESNASAYGLSDKSLEPNSNEFIITEAEEFRTESPNLIQTSKRKRKRVVIESESD